MRPHFSRRWDRAKAAGVSRKFLDTPTFILHPLSFSLLSSFLSFILHPLSFPLSLFFFYPSSFILYPSLFFLLFYPSSFILYPFLYLSSFFILHPSSFILSFISLLFSFFSLPLHPTAGAKVLTGLSGDRGCLRQCLCKGRSQDVMAKRPVKDVTCA